MNLPPEVRALVRTRLAPAAATAYLATARPSIGYATADEGWSAFGGDPECAAFTWPLYQGQPMLLLADLDCEEAAGLLGGDWPFPDDGRLLFFHDDDFSAPWSSTGGDDGCRVLHVPGEPITPLPPIRKTIGFIPLTAAPQAALPGPDDEDHPADATLGITLPGRYHLAEDIRPLLPAPRHRLLGYPDHLGPAVKGHRPLLQLEADEGTTWGEVVSVTFWITEADLRTATLTNVRRSYETA
jgi:hypothetical protein